MTPTFFSATFAAAVFTVLAIGQTAAHAQTPPPLADTTLPAWDNRTYPDAPGFLFRTSGMVERLAKQDMGIKCMAPSSCPDTGLTVRTFALKGETIVSPYTGRQYIQGEVGFFGPQKRGADGRITAFGNDPLKRDLPPAIARLLLNPHDEAAKGFLSIPGSMRQQYHFAAVHWTRFYPLVGSSMPPAWQKEWRDMIAVYTENNRPSDGFRKADPLEIPHDLIGQPGELLGGNVKDGGTENHKTMWRTSGLLYAQWFAPEGGRVSGFSAPDAEARITPMLTGFLQTILSVGNGEYDSSTYYPYAMMGYLNLYDFSPKPETRHLGKAMLDYYLATYGLKSVNGVHAGAEKRGWAGDGDVLGDMDAQVWTWAKNSTVPVDQTKLITSIQQATTTYHPNRVLHHILTRNIPLPFEAQMARPSYHSKEKNVFQETYYGAQNYGLGSVALTQVDNPTQQTVWRLVCDGDKRAWVFGGGQPHFRHPEGHSAYDQTLQKQGTLLLMSGPTKIEPNQPTDEQKARTANAGEKLMPLPPPAAGDAQSLQAWWDNAPKGACSWLFVPRDAQERALWKNGAAIAAGKAWVSVHAVGGTPYWVHVPDNQIVPKEMEILRKYDVWVVTAGSDGMSGFVVDVANQNEYATLADFARKAQTKTVQKVGATVHYTSLAGNALTMTYQPTGLRAMGTINNQPVDWKNWANGGMFDSPYVKIKNGQMTVSDGRETYTVGYNPSGVLEWR